MATRKRGTKPDPRPRSGANVEDWQRGTERITLRLKPEVMAALRAMAKGFGCSVAEWLTGHDSACDCCPDAVRTGAAIAFGLMGMAEAIKRNGPRADAPCEECGKPTTWWRAYCDGCENGTGCSEAPESRGGGT